MSPPPGLQPGSGGGPSPTRGPGGQRAVAEALGALLLPLPLRGQERADGGGRVRGRGGGGWRSSIPLPPPLLPRGWVEADVEAGRAGRGSGQEKT